MTHEEKCLSQPIEQNSGDMLSRQIELRRRVADLAEAVAEDENGDVLAKIKALEAMEITPVAALKIAKGVLNYGRVEVVLGRTELNKLFAGDVSVIYCEYDQRTEELRICVEGSGLFKNWREGQRPFNVRGKLLDSSYVMMVKDDHPRYLEFGPMDDMGQAELACINCGKTAHRPRQRCETLNSDKDGGRVCMNCGWNSDE